MGVSPPPVAPVPAPAVLEYHSAQAGLTEPGPLRTAARYAWISLGLFVVDAGVPALCCFLNLRPPPVAGLLCEFVAGFGIAYGLNADVPGRYRAIGWSMAL